VPVANGSNVELVLELEGAATAAEINAHLRQAAEGPLQGILEYSVDPLVSADVVGNPHSAVFDSLLTHCMGGGQTTLARLLAWYDNEWGYSSRLAELLTR
jgi:glyceraldehyde 3-phosphate dehydrogenase